MTKKSILYIITKSVWGGAARYIYDLATHLSNEFEAVVAAGGQGKFAQKIKETGLPYYQIKNFQRSINPFKDFFSFFEIIGLISQLKPDIIHVNSSKAGGLVGITAWLYKFFTGRRLRLIFTAHGWAFNEDRPQWQLALIKLFSKLTALFYDKIICVSQYDRQIAIENKIAPVDKLVAIHNGIDIENISFLSKEEAQKKLLGKTSPLVIGTIAEWTKNKGLFYLLEAILRSDLFDTTFLGKIYPKRLYQKGLTSRFDVILIGSGENPDKEKMYSFIKKHELKNVHLIEWLDQAASYLKAFDIFVLPSIKEGLPYTILEAMAAETPIIATNVGGVPETSRSDLFDTTFFAIAKKVVSKRSDLDSLILVEPKNSQQLAEKIIYLIENPKITKEMAKKARQKVEEEFGLEQMLQETKKLYQS